MAKNISQSDATELLQTATEMVAVLKARGFHLSDYLVTPDGKPTVGETPFQALQRVIDKIRYKQARIPKQ